LLPINILLPASFQECNASRVYPANFTARHPMPSNYSIVKNKVFSILCQVFLKDYFGKSLQYIKVILLSVHALGGSGGLWG